MMRSAAHIRKKKVTVEMLQDGKTETIPAKQFIHRYLNIDINRYPKDSDDKTLTKELNLKIGKLTKDKSHKGMTQIGLQKKLKKVENQDNKIHQKKTRSDGSHFSRKERFESLAKNFKRFGVGNCSDRAKFNMIAAIEFPIKLDDFSEISANQKGITIEYFSLMNYDHAIAVVNRKLDSDPGNPREWGEHAVIIDSWWFLHDDIQHGVFSVAKELQQYDMGKANTLFVAIMDAAASQKLSNGTGEHQESFYFGEGHTQHWKEVAKHGKHPEFLCDYSDIKPDEEIEQKNTPKRGF